MARKQVYRARLNAPYILDNHVWRNTQDNTVNVGLVLEHEERGVTLVLSKQEAQKLHRQLAMFSE